MQLNDIIKKVREADSDYNLIKHIFDGHYVDLDANADISLDVKTRFADDDNWAIDEPQFIISFQRAYHDKIESKNQIFIQAIEEYSGEHITEKYDTELVFNDVNSLFHFAAIVQKRVWKIIGLEDMAHTSLEGPVIENISNPNNLVVAPIMTQEDIEKEAEMEAKKYLDRTVGKQSPPSHIKKMGIHERRNDSNQW